MKTIFFAAVFFLSMAVPLLADGTNSVLADDKSRFSYALGMYLAHSWQQQNVDVDVDLLTKAIKDLQSGGAVLLTPQEMTDILKNFQQQLAARQQKMRDDITTKNKTEGEAFLATNKDNPGVITLPDGLQYKVITDGSGPVPTAADIVTVNYSGKLLDGTEFDSSYKRGQPASLPVGGLIAGWTEALTHMKVGSKWQLFIPSDLAYMAQGRPGIPPNSVLIFDVELLSTQPPAVVAPPAPAGPPMTSDIIKVPSAEEMKNGAKVEIMKPEDVQKLQQSEAQPGR